MFRLFQRRRQACTIRALYGTIVAQARLTEFYAGYGVPDTVEGRFDMIVLHTILVFRRMRDDAMTRSLGQGVFDHFCQDMDRSFREMGIGDLSVPKHMRRVGEAFYGRAAAYEAALAQHDGGAAFHAALARNVFAQTDTLPAGVRRLAAYVGETIDCLNAQDNADFGQGLLTFPDPGTIGVSGEGREEAH